MNTNNLLLYAVTDRNCLDNITLAQAVENALKGGVTMVQLREKNMSFEEFVKSAEEILSICRKYNVPMLINDNVKVCMAVNADGVHLGQGDMPISEARKILGKDKIIGITAKTIEQAQSAERDGADYLGSGAVFGTSTKADAKKMELSTLKEICSSVNIPVAAIGGISIENVSQLKGTGIKGIAVVSGIFAHKNITDITKKLYSETEAIVK